MIARRLLFFTLLSALPCGIALAATPLPSIRFSPDVTTSYGALTVPTNAMVEETIATTSMAAVSIGVIPAGVAVDGYAVASNGDHLVSFDTTVVLGGSTFAPRDVVRYDGVTYSLEFDGEAAGVPNGVNVHDIAVNGKNLLMSFDSTVFIGAMTVGPEDVVSHFGNAFTLFFDGSLLGVPPGAVIDGVHLLASDHLLLSFDTSAQIGGVDFDDEDILEYTPSGGTWQMAYDGSSRWPNWPAGDLRAFSIAEPPAAPVGLISTASTSTKIESMWDLVAADSYQVDRKSPAGDYVQIGTSDDNFYFDDTVVPGTAYLYRVRAVNFGLVSANSSPDLATTVIFTNSSLSGIAVKAVHLSELRTAVNAVRHLAGKPPGTFTDEATPGVTVKAVHFTELQDALDFARSILGLSTGGYSDGSLVGVRIKAVHSQELRARVE